MRAAAADAVFALPELRGAIMAQRVRGMARDRVRSLKVGKSAGKQEAGVHQPSVRCGARGCTENVRLGAVAHGRLVCNRCLPPWRYALNGKTARVYHLVERRNGAEAFWRTRGSPCVA